MLRVDKLVIVYHEAFVTLSVHLYTVYIYAFAAFRFHGLYHNAVIVVIVSVKRNGHLVEYRRGKCIVGFTGTVGIKAHHAVYGPSRHGSGIVIAGQSCRVIAEMLLQQSSASSIPHP